MKCNWTELKGVTDLRVWRRPNDGSGLVTRVFQKQGIPLFLASWRKNSFNLRNFLSHDGFKWPVLSHLFSAFSLTKTALVLTHLRQRFFWPLFPIGSWTLRAVTHDEAGLEQGRARFWRRKVQDKNPYSESSLKIGHPCFWRTLFMCACVCLRSQCKWCNGAVVRKPLWLGNSSQGCTYFPE